MWQHLVASDYTPESELLRRINGLKEKMAEAGIGFSVIMQNADLFYFSGTIQKAVMVIPLDDEPLLFVERSLERAHAETPLAITRVDGDKKVAAILRQKGLLKGTGGMELDVVPVSVFERFKKLVGFDNFKDVAGLIRDLRIIKSPFEIEQVKRSGRIISRIFEKAKDVVREGMREIDVDAELVAEGRRYGHQGFLRMRGFNQEMMNLYVTAGLSSGVPSNADVPISGLGLTAAIAQGSSLKVVERGVPVVVDYGGGYNGYVTDETRVFVVGEMKDRFRKGYEVAREIVEDVTAFGKEGVDCTEIFERARQLVRKADLQDHFMGFGEGQVSFIGHGLGLEINELPVITPRHHRILQEGMVFAFEPKFIFPGEGSVGIEVDFIVRREGLERVVEFPIAPVYV
ncbi:MAG TPA: Xaa-Pro peptidase family protein [Syntrophorhabdales bacterium]|nr:Xaa-Pro peptidase family protein [Syntrophorhabdales bacterium]